MEWISVNDKLPPEGVEVLTIDNNNLEFPEYRIDYIVTFQQPKDPYIWACRIENEYEKVTHWMPLPKPPEGK